MHSAALQAQVPATQVSPVLQAGAQPPPVPLGAWQVPPAQERPAQHDSFSQLSPWTAQPPPVVDPVLVPVVPTTPPVVEPWPPVVAP